MRGRKKKYTAKALEAAVEHWFDSITVDETLTKSVPTGETDEKGNEIFTSVPVLNRLGEEIVQTKYLIPPTVEGLCLFLDISYGTWEDYCDEKKHPEFLRTTTRARARMREWNMRQLLTREGKDTRGIIFNLQNNYGMKERKEMSLDEKTTEAIEKREMTMAEKMQLLEELRDGAMRASRPTTGEAEDGSGD